ncbi:cobaltochelatase CobN [Ferrimonas marina]|uniref:Cobaltochelatase CobN n=1 Tax=Ferrimonas marina TaxID=299255 RepID=A0A1M5MTF9_9GAMM|nr:cobaltochelatase CobN [Ferrimonas marina]
MLIGALALISPLLAPVAVAAEVVILTTDFPPEDKYVRMTQMAEAQGVTLRYHRTPELNPVQWQDADLVIFDTPRFPDRQRVQAMVDTESMERPFLMVGGGPPVANGLPGPLMGRLLGYYGHGTALNFERLFQTVAAWQSGDNFMAIAEAQPVPEQGIYHQGGWHDSLAQHLEAQTLERLSVTEQPLLGVIISRASIVNMQLRELDDLHQAISDAGIRPVIYWFDANDPDGMSRIWAEHQPTALLNTTHLQGGDARKAELEALGVPMMSALGFTDTIAEFRRVDSAIPPHSLTALVTGPESWGMSDPLVLWAQSDAGVGGEPQLIPEQLRLLTERIHALHQLRTVPVSEQRLALVFYNSPAGAENLSASHLNVPVSIDKIASALNEAGYSVAETNEEAVIAMGKELLSGYYQTERLPELLASGHAQFLPLTRYAIWFERLPAQVKREVNRKWGPAANHSALVEHNGQLGFAFPAYGLDDLWILPQPPRTAELSQQGGHAVHDTKTAPDHRYLAVYLWLQQEMHALIHLGTHGSQEWTPGKDRGLWAYDYPMLTLGGLPVVYPYIQDNVAEALQAKRRGRATIVSHQAPAFGPAGLYSELIELNQLMDQFEQAEGALRIEVGKQLRQVVREHGFDQDLGLALDEAEVMDEALAEQDIDLDDRLDQQLETLRDHVDLIAASAVPLGLHHFGDPAKVEHRLLTVLQQLGEEFYAEFDLTPGQLLSQPPEALAQSEPVQWLQAVLLDELGAEASRQLAPVLPQWQKEARERFIWLTETHEIPALMTALRGGFVKAGLGGDPLRQPQATSGTNLYGFDPAMVPTPAAFRAAEAELDALLAAQADATDQGEALPEKLAFSLWAGETQRHFGLLEAQVLHALGVEPVWDRGGRVVAMTVLPESELKRPRLDVVLQITSVYRDQFDGFMRLLSGAIEEIAALDEDNALRRSSLALAAELEAQGVDTQRAWQLATLRLFSNAPGDYGSGVNDLAIDSTEWEDDLELGQQYLNRLQYAYGSALWGEKLEETNLFAEQLKDVDVAVMARTSRLHGLLSTDHPFEYLGGLSAAVRAAGGEAPQLFISDLRQPQSRMVSVDRMLSEELRARYLNPQWISAMQEQGYAGAVEMLNVTNNLFGWQVTAPETVRDDQWQAMFDTFVEDRHELGLNEWFEQHQPAAQMQILERMAEAIRKDYWEADEATLQALVERHSELAEMVEYHQAANKTQEFIDTAAAGFGLGAGAGGSSGQSVSGYQMVEVPATELAALPDRTALLVSLFLMMIVGAGMLAQVRQQRTLRKRD